MCTRRDTFVKAAALLATMRMPGEARQSSGQGTSQRFSIPFEYAEGLGSLLVRARINQRSALLIVDTGSSHTIVRPTLIGVKPSELASPQTGGGVIGDAVGREVTLEVGAQVWQRRRVAVMDLSRALAEYREQIDGLLGLDFFLEFSQAIIALKERTVTFIR
jgi:aspartyl protease